jgi:hypothetical protein
VYNVKCVHEDCLWRVHDSKDRWKTHWSRSIITQCNYSSEPLTKTQRNMISAFVSEEIYGVDILPKVAFMTWHICAPKNPIKA